MSSIQQVKDICRSILANDEAKNKAIILWGPPGIGKTDCLAQLAQELNAKYKTFLTATMDPTDVVGVPHPVNGLTEFLPPKDFFEMTNGATDKGPMIACFDDLPAGNEAVFNSLLRFFHNREVGGKPVRDNVFLCATGNRSEDRANARELGTALNNRFVHFDISPSNEEWREWAINNSVPKEIIGFVGAHADMLHKFNPEESIRAFPTPRSVVTAGVMQKALGLENPNLFTALAGACGEGWAVTYQAYLRNTELSVPPEEIVKNPTKCRVPKETDIDILHATIASLTCHMFEKIQTMKDTTAIVNMIEAGYVYSTRLPITEMGIVLGRDIMRNIVVKTTDVKARIKVLDNPHYSKFVEQYAKYIKS